jgi:hypothetical protein
LEIAVLPFPNPTSAGLTVDEFVNTYITENRISSFIIKPYAAVDPVVLREVVKKPLAYYETAGTEVNAVSTSMVQLLRGFKAEYSQMVTVADWHGDPMALEYLLSLQGESATTLLGNHNMLHIKSFARGKFGGGSTFEAQKLALGVKLMESHEAKHDCREIAEVTVRALCHARDLMRKGEPTRVKTKRI